MNKNDSPFPRPL